MYIGWRNRIQTALLASLIAAGLVAAQAAKAQSQTAEGEAQSGVVLMYHRFGEPDLPSTNIKMDQFRAHLSVLEKRDQPVLPLADMMARVKAGDPLPDRAIAITVDDAFRSFMTEAWPLLKEKGYPVTLFVATDPVDEGYKRYLSWDEIRQLEREGVTIGHHGAGHINMVDEGVEAARRDLRRASERFEAELGARPDMFAYPYGEYSTAVARMVREEGFTAAMAQHSGGLRTGSDPYTVPRFALNERFGDTERFRMISQVHAFDVTDMVPEGPVVGANSQNPPVYGFTVRNDVPDLTRLNCFASHQSGRIAPKVLPEQRVEIRYDEPMPTGRNRTTCTLLGRDGRWFWHGKFFYVMD